MGVINPLTPEVETPEQVKQRPRHRGEAHPGRAPRRDRRLRLLAVQPRPQAQARLAGLRPRRRDAEDLRAPRGRAHGLRGARRLTFAAAGREAGPPPPWLDAARDRHGPLSALRARRRGRGDRARPARRRCTASGCASTSSRDDVVRVKISRGGVFDEAPTFAVCVDPLAEPVDVRGRARRRRRPAAHRGARRLAVARPVPPRRPPPRRQRRSSRPPRRDGRYWAYATLNDAFTVRRRCRPEDAIYGLGEKTGRHNRQRPRLHALEHRRPRPARRPPSSPRAGRPTTRARTARASSSTRTTSRSRSSTTTTQPTGAMAGSFVDNGYRADVRLLAPEEYAIRFEGGQYTEYVFAGPGHAGHPRGLHVADRPHRAAAAVGARLPPVPLVPLHAGRGRGARARATASSSVPCDALWLDIEYMDGYRVFTWDTEAFPDAGRRCSRASPSRASGSSRSSTRA